jgi:RNA polymerase sigma factor (sigma-70 family)
MTPFPAPITELRFLHLAKNGGAQGWRHAPHAASIGQTRVDQIFRRHAAEMRRYLQRRGVAGGDADDVLQRVFLVLVRRIDDIVSGCERAFLFRAAAHEVAHVRRSFARCLEQSEDWPEWAATDDVRPDELLMNKMARERLALALADLDAGLRETFELVAFQDISLTEVAARLGIPVGTAKTRLRRARAVLSAFLDEPPPAVTHSAATIP